MDDLDLNPAIFIGGWYNGIKGEGHLNKILKCYQPNDTLSATLGASMDAYIKGDYPTGDSKMIETYPLYKQALSGCGNLGELINYWLLRTSDLTSSPDWPQKWQQIYAQDKDQIDSYYALRLSKW